MATTNNVRNLFWNIVTVGLVTLVAVGMTRSAVADDTPDKTADEVVSQKVIDDAADQIEKFCKARKMSTLQLLEFRGTVGSMPQADVKQDWLDSLKERGIVMQDADSIRIQGRIVTQQAGNSLIVVLQCTMSDNTGAELCTFRSRRVIVNAGRL